MRVFGRDLLPLLLVVSITLPISLHGRNLRTSSLTKSKSSQQRHKQRRNRKLKKKPNGETKDSNSGLGFGPIQNNLGFDAVKGSGFSLTGTPTSTQPPPPSKQGPPNPQKERPKIEVMSGGLYGEGIGEPYVPEPRASDVETETPTKDGPTLANHGTGIGFQQQIQAEEAGLTLELNTGYNVMQGSVSSSPADLPEETLHTYFIKLNKTKDEMAENTTSTLIRKNCNGQRKSRANKILSNFIIVDSKCVPEELLESGLVESIDEDEDVYADFEGCSTPFSVGDDYAWGIDRVDDVFGVNNEFGLPYNGEDVDVFIIDTGVDDLHEQFIDENGESRVKGYYDCVGVDLGKECPSIPSPGQRTLCNGETGSDHGTHVAGSCCGNTIGVAPKANIYSYRVFSCTGSAKLHYIVNALDWIKERCIAEDSNPCVVNLSLGTGVKPVLNDAVESVVEAGIVVVVSAGNNNGKDSCEKSPASALSAITVAASDINDGIPSYVNKGPCIDIIAPGDAIFSAAGIGGYDLMYGTSMAAPHVTGAAAVFLSEKNQATPQVVTNALTLTYPRVVIEDTRYENENYSYPLLHMPCGCGDDGNHSHVCGSLTSPITCAVSDCTTCEPDNINSCILCEPGFGLDGTGGCAQCSEGCNSCSDASTCDECAEGFGPVLDLGSCASCGSGCVNCDTDQAVCSQCAPGLGRDPENVEMCKSCADGCDGCNNMDYQSCIACQPGYGFSGSGSACSPCSASNCALCSVNNNLCTECDEGLMLVGDMCVALQVNECGAGDIQIEIYSDWYPQDVEFEIIDPDGGLFLRSYPLQSQWTTYRYNLTRFNDNLTDTNCEWKFRMIDTWGDGLYSPAYYALYSGTVLLHRGGGSFTPYTSLEETMF